MKNLQALFRNKKMLYGVGAAGALGLVVLLMRKKQPGGDGEPPKDVEGGTTTLQPGTYDSTGSDIYNGLQALYAGQDARWVELIGSLNDVKSKLPSTPPPAPGGGTTLPGGNTGPFKPPGTRKLLPGGAAYSVKTKATTGRWSWDNLVDYFYNTAGWTPAQKRAAAARLADANKKRWFGARPGTYAYSQITGGYGGTVAGGAVITVPGQL